MIDDSHKRDGEEEAEGDLPEGSIDEILDETDDDEEDDPLMTDESAEDRWE